MNKLKFLFILFAFLSSQVKANITLPKFVNDNMVLQREMQLPIWGWAAKGEKVTVSILTQTVSAKADNDGKWMLKLSALPAGGPYEMTIKGKNTIVLKNILVGDVWLCSGQSNMQYTISQFKYAEKEIADANYPQIRLFTVPNTMSARPKYDLPSGNWQEAIHGNIAEFSAVAYFFGRDLYKKLNVPIGLINSSWGGTEAESWISLPVAKEFPEFRTEAEQLEKNPDIFETGLKEIEAQKQKLKEDFVGKDMGYKNGKPVWSDVFFTNSDWSEMDLPQKWEGAGLPDYDGTVWYKKEFVLPENMKKKNLLISLGNIDDMDITWINGVQVGAMNEYNLYREYSIPANILKEGKNEVIVRVTDISGGGGFAGRAEHLHLKTTDKTNQIVYSLAGKWNYKKGYDAGKLSPLYLKMYPNNYTSLLYNSMILPLIPYAIKGVIWYQGEANAERAYQYRTLLPVLIKNWRTDWAQGDFPFLIVQLANFQKFEDQPSESAWAELREAQTMTLSVPKTGMALAIDLGEAKDIHPANKQEVGRRLALAARKIAYGEDLIYSGPMYDTMTIEGDKIKIKFKNTGTGLMSKDKYGYLKGFSIAGEDKKFFWAQAYIEGTSVVVYSDKIKSPLAVRYAWANNPEEANLYNKEGLPACPFRTDDWPGITFGKK